MSKWHIPHYREYEEAFILQRIGSGLDNVVMTLTAEKERLEKEKNNLEIELDNSRDSFMKNIHEERRIQTIEHCIENCKTIEAYLLNNGICFLEMIAKLENSGCGEHNGDFLVKHILHYVGIEDAFEYLIEEFVKYSLHKDITQLYTGLYRHLKRITACYMIEKEMNKEVRVPFDGKPKRSMIDSSMPQYKKERIKDKALCRTASLVIETVTGINPTVDAQEARV